jgi:hypothetical protein
LVLPSKFRFTKNSPCTPPAKKLVECSARCAVAARGRKALAGRRLRRGPTTLSPRSPAFLYAPRIKPIADNEPFNASLR